MASGWTYQSPWAKYQSQPRPKSQSVLKGPDGPGEYDESGNFKAITPGTKSASRPSSGGGGTSYSSSTKSSSKSSSKESDAYKKQRQMMEKTRKNIEGAFKNLLSSLDPTYNRYRTDYGAAADKTLATRKQELLAQQIAYGTADSEQRQQAEERLAAEIFGERDNYYSKLAEQEAAQRAEIAYKQAMALSGLDQNMANSYIDEQKYKDTLRQQDFENSIKRLSGGGGTKDSWTKVGYVKDASGRYGIHSINRTTGESRIDPIDENLAPAMNNNGIEDMLYQMFNGGGGIG